MSVYKIDPFTMKKRKLEENKGEDTKREMCMYVCVYVLGLVRVHLCNSMDCSPPDSSVHGIF